MSCWIEAPQFAFMARAAKKDLYPYGARPPTKYDYGATSESRRPRSPALPKSYRRSDDENRCDRSPQAGCRNSRNPLPADEATSHLAPHRSTRDCNEHAAVGVDITVIALWLGHESTATTHMYVEADLAMKERALKTLQAPSVKASRFRPEDRLLAFLEGL